MFCYRSLLQNLFEIKTLPLPIRHKVTNSGKANVIKSYNTENKHLFGNLIESQKQRRKNISHSKVTPSTDLSSADDRDAKVSQNKLVEEAKKKTRAKKNKNSKTNTIFPIPVLTEVLGVESVSQSDASITLNSECSPTSLTPKERSKVVVESLPLNNLPENASQELRGSENDVDKTLSTEKIVFKSIIDINEFNYPLQNTEKSYFSIQNGSVESVLSYGFSDPLVKDYAKYPSVSKIMEETMAPKNKLILSKWRQNMIADLGEEGFTKHCADLKTRGHEFHQAVRDTVLGRETENASKVTRKALKSLEWMLDSVSSPMAVESLIAHPQLEYKGIPDCVAMFRNIPVVIDWKLSDKPKKDLKDTYEAPVQITAYIGALNHDPNYKWGVNHGLVAVAYTSGDPCDVFLLAPKHCEIYWRHWLQRFDKFKARSHLHLDHEIDEKALGFS